MTNCDDCERGFHDKCDNRYWGDHDPCPCPCTVFDNMPGAEASPSDPAPPDDEYVTKPEVWDAYMRSTNGQGEEFVRTEPSDGPDWWPGKDYGWTDPQDTLESHPTAPSFDWLSSIADRAGYVLVRGAGLSHGDELAPMQTGQVVDMDRVFVLGRRVAAAVPPQRPAPTAEAGGAGAGLTPSAGDLNREMRAGVLDHRSDRRDTIGSVPASVAANTVPVDERERLHIDSGVVVEPESDREVPEQTVAEGDVHDASPVAEGPGTTPGNTSDGEASAAGSQPGGWTVDVDYETEPPGDLLRWNDDIIAQVTSNSEDDADARQAYAELVALVCQSDAREVIGRVVDWCGVADWSGPPMPLELGRDIDRVLRAAAVPPTAKCDDCLGYGYTPAEGQSIEHGTVDCESCDGTGVAAAVPPTDGDTE